MSIEASIHAALEAHLRAFAEPRQIRVARQGFAFDPPMADGQDANGNSIKVPVTYLRTSFLPNRSADNPIRDEDQPARMGLFQVSVVSPPDRGLNDSLTLSGQIIEHFRRARLPANGWLVRVTEAPWASPPMQDSDRLQVPVTIPWVATPQ